MLNHATRTLRFHQLSYSVPNSPMRRCFIACTDAGRARQPLAGWLCRQRSVMRRMHMITFSPTPASGAHARLRTRIRAGYLRVIAELRPCQLHATDIIEASRQSASFDDAPYMHFTFGFRAPSFLLISDKIPLPTHHFPHSLLSFYKKDKNSAALSPWLSSFEPIVRRRFFSSARRRDTYFFFLLVAPRPL